MSDRKEITLIGTAEGVKHSVNFQFSPELYAPGNVKSTKVFITVHIENEENIFEMEWEDLNNFCLDLFNEHKKIMANRNA